MVENLNYREEQVYNLAVSTPYDAEKIGQKLGIRVPTVRTYLNRIYLIMGVTSRLELVIDYYKRLIKQN